MDGCDCSCVLTWISLYRVAYGSMVAGDWASIALPVELDASGTGAAVVEAPLAPVNLQKVDANDIDKVPASSTACATIA